MRKSGILLPIFSLPSRFGIGSLGVEAYKFIDFLSETGQSVWQILPITSTGKEDFYSPYKTNGAFSGNYDLIDIDTLVLDGILSRSFVESIDTSKYDTDPRYVDYDKVRDLKTIFLNKAFENFNSGIKKNEEIFINLFENYRIFESENKFWLNEFSRYMAISEKNNFQPYWKWKNIENNALEEKIYYYKFTQFLFYNQYMRLKSYANSKNIEIFGDIPIYVSRDSSDFYYNREIFLTDKDGEPSVVSGVPPDAFSKYGQCWGNPIYDWDYLEKNNFSWWIKRLEKALELYDILKIDHFRGFESYYCVDPNTENAMDGYWEKAPGKKFFSEVKARKENANIVAEDLGSITDDVRKLLDFTGYPGMKILQFGFNSDSQNLNLPFYYYKNTVAYTGTHDNMPLAAWLKNCSTSELEYAKKYLRLSSYERYTEGLIRSVMESSSDLCIVPIVDWMDFGEFSRINTPSTVGINWKFRLLPNEIYNDDLKNYIKHITGLYGRFR